DFYRLDTLFGELTVDGSGVTCEGPGCPNLQNYVAEISISGSVTMGAVLMPALLEGFAQRNGYQATRIDEDDTHFAYTLTDTRGGARVATFMFRVTTSDEGFADLLANEADVVMSLREIRPDEQARAADAGMGDMNAANRTKVLALDAIVPVVSPQNPIRDISPLQAARVYAGQITNWAELGGPDAPIDLHAPSPATGLGQAMEDQLLGPAGLTMSPRATLHLRGDALADAVSKAPFAFGFSSYAEIGNAKPLTLKGSCGRELRATRRSIKTEDYPLTAPMYLYTPARMLPKIAREFLLFTASSDAQNVVRRAGFVDQALEEVGVSMQGDRFANAISAAGSDTPLSELKRMTDRLRPLNRLTTSFRFEEGATRLDAQSRSNLVQLSQRIEQGRFDGRRLYFIGFSDGQGPAIRNRQIALQSAETVRDTVRSTAEAIDKGQVALSVDAFGEAMPLACDDSSWGRQANRRVEVWVR
ncbi:MAG: phosphate ABC transporter substrate-binding/OmpA family protein, partial [Roseobacter sp.]|nr:phosphate ABC transporter substrate-binding/OmpA family protein [Roseobacter sp.]